MAQSKLESTRLKVDPSIGVIDLQRVLKKHVDNAPDKDIWNILKHPTGAPFSWKTSVCIPWIGQAADLLVDFLKVAPNGLLPAAKLRLSLKRLVVDGTEKTKKVNRTNYATDDWVDQVDSRIRIMLAQVRALKKQDEYLRAVRRATESEKARIDMVLSHLLYHDENTVGASSSSKGAANICSPKAVASARAAEEPTVFGRPLMVGDLGSSSSEECASKAAASSSSRPVRKVATEAQDGVTRAPKPLVVSEGASYGLDAADVAIMNQSMEQKVLKGNQKKPLKKPAAVVLGNTKKQAEAKTAAKSAAKPKAVAKAKGSGYKCSFKKRRTSSVYHKERTLRISMGDSPQTAKTKARAAMAEVASKIDAGIITENDP
ncbi:unnamed protein product [Symbiodinium microadriaticum]|nr:unnamed protein product [Symbiodinium microadriaticum]